MHIYFIWFNCYKVHLSQTAMNHPTPEYITAQLSHILNTLQQDIDANNAKHHHELTIMRQIIQAKDEEINALNSQLRKHR